MVRSGSVRLVALALVLGASVLAGCELRDAAQISMSTGQHLHRDRR